MTMRRGAGLAALDRQKASLQSYASLSSDLSRENLAALESQLTQFRTALTHFAMSHRQDILRDPAFRSDFQQMCAAIGVDPLAGPRKGGWWAELVGMGDWTYELGVQIVDVCVGTRERNGGMIEMGELVRLLNRLRGIGEAGGEGAITEEDVLRSIRTLAPLGTGYEVVEIGRRKLVRSVVKELDADQAKVLEIAAVSGGRIWGEFIAETTGWTQARSRTVLENMLMRDGLCWIDEQDTEASSVYWVTSVIEWD
jgi:ESCRT-II complex subunit VPS22